MNSVSHFLQCDVRKFKTELSNLYVMHDRDSQLHFEEILKEYYPFITKVCAGFSDTDDELKDLVQEVCYRIWKNFGSFRGGAKVSTWIYRVTINVCLYEQSVKSRQRAEFVGQDQLEGFGETAEKLSGENQLKDKLHMVLKKLKPEERALIMLYLEKNTHNQIAEILGLTSTNVGVKINRIKKKLKKLINHE